VTLNGREAKPAARVLVGDLVGLSVGTHRLVVKVLRLPEGRPSPEPAYEVVEEQQLPGAWSPDGGG
jgi:ribosomal 50S subunit-recycling heat shock protein